MGRTSSPIDAVGAIVREALIGVPNQTWPRVADSVGAEGPHRGVVEIQVTVKMSDVVAALTSTELAVGDNLSFRAAFALTNDDGTLVGSGSALVYREATELARTGLSSNQHRALRNVIAGRRADENLLP